MHLRSYLWKENLTQREFSKRLGISESYLCSILKKRARPSVKLSEKIEEITQGKVTAKELLFPKY